MKGCSAGPSLHSVVHARCGGQPPPGQEQCLSNGSARHPVQANWDYWRDMVVFSHLILTAWYSFLKSFSLQPLFTKKVGERNVKNEKIWIKVILTRKTWPTRDGHFTVEAWRAMVLQSMHEALAGQWGYEERRPHISKCPDQGSHPLIIQMHPIASSLPV